MNNLGHVVYLGDEADDDKVVDQVPGDDEVSEGAIYVTKDHKHITLVEACSEDSEDSIFDLSFPDSNDDSNGGTDFAYADLAVFSGGGQSGGEGTTTVIRGETDADLSVDGKWKVPEED